MTTSDAEHIAVTRFRQYLRIKTVQPTPDYASCKVFLQSYATELGLDFRCVEMTAGKPICILTWVGTNPSLKSILLNSHTDVVPVSETHWTHDPFAADKLPNGDIIARGTQDMKCVGIGYLEAIRILKAKGVKLERTLHCTFVPDEEIASHDGMMPWVKTDDFRSLNPAFALDEGLANPEDAYKVYYGERAPWWIKITAKGGAGHASQFIEPSATERLVRVLSKFVAFRDAEKLRLAVCRNEFGRRLRIGDVTTTNITMMNAGVQFNVVPEEAWVGVDMRVAPSVHLPTFREQMIKWCTDEDTTVTFEQAFMSNACTPLTDDNPWWKEIEKVGKTRKIILDPEIFPAATDSRFIREVGIPAIGISCIRNHPVLLHDHNEYLNEKMLIEGVEFYVDLLPGLASISSTVTP
ncbi:hypothetical protein BATDEDRAFT_91704 [Batrachochytrium dendrobatidis JAM81]|uniref:N-acyl-aliphatic-L-amino acid amidohydrolase n=1 Tax=Batrachochytrium dendrobatidis (strain JAM81 / FGSC 10211) TaxID=684364 RepID=F4PBQ2_BATDJ|nr:uncharacterized protein BATDEDRAFT_91704 [Batrachochytrium dendrobatidis JAM81]EGF77365.1 hypothetical protein BATDEDRAFT_91704 [Batrachochytrium dendrobatidis JAM81]KAJ8327559.1 adenylate cyclase [Batrachochytrium dendrobatidis]KAK5669195.1 adenylate cyclase [Batrachochytrium dendrobatidis]|eukprot:XP_006682055.1 hypothetical protein BATDEDRAFT_91704 [Batrachochytrium dendrobatidis JAM81]